MNSFATFYFAFVQSYWKVAAIFISRLCFALSLSSSFMCVCIYLVMKMTGETQIVTQYFIFRGAEHTRTQQHTLNAIFGDRKLWNKTISIIVRIFIDRLLLVTYISDWTTKQNSIHKFFFREQPQQQIHTWSLSSAAEKKNVTDKTKTK